MYSGRVIAGVGIGGMTAVAPTFVSECAPKEVRGRITGLFQVMSSIGIMLSYWINCKPQQLRDLLGTLSDHVS
jgi:MFS family permease